MAQEAVVSSSLRINKDNLQWNPQPANFIADVLGTKGPTPGCITATTAGTDVDLSQLGDPGLCTIRNLDSTNWVSYGLWIPGTLNYYPLGELLPGEEYVLRLSRDLGEQFTNTGTGTTASVNRLRLKANGASVNVFVGAFER